MARFGYIGICLLVLLGVLSCKDGKTSAEAEISVWDSQKQQPLLDFEEKKVLESLQAEHATLALTTTGASQGQQALKVNFESDIVFSGFTFQPETPIDARNLGDYSLVFEATNFGEHSTHLYVIVENEQGEQRKRSVSIPASGETNTYFFELEGPYLREDTNMRDNPNPWPSSVQMKMRGRIEPTDFSKITSIQFFVKHT
ncbi:MAG: hypothetical protein AAF765_06310, partial [Bacteroidota bacterium]